MAKERKILYEGKFKRLVYENGWEFVERVNCSGVVVILAVTNNAELVLVEQLRVPVGRKVIELPAGLVNDLPHKSGEKDVEAARRELIEETGYDAEKFDLMFIMPASPAFCGEMISVFRARGLKKVGSGGGDHLESITPHVVPLKSIDQWLEQKKEEGNLVDSKVYMMLYLLEKERAIWSSAGRALGRMAPRGRRRLANKRTPS